MIKLFVSDLDGTLINRQMMIEEYNQQAIRHAMEHGIHIAIASGRMSTEIRGLMQNFPEKSYAIGQNGATVYSKEHTLITASQHKPEIAYRIMQLGMQYKELVVFVHTTNDEAYIQESNERSQQYEPRVLTPSIVMADFDKQVEQGSLPCSKVTFLGDIHLLRQLQQQLENELGDIIEVVVSDYDCMDVTPLNVSKGRAVELLMEQLSLSTNEVACIGDSYNDLSMFKVAGHSFAMRHSDQAIKDQAKYVVNNVAEAIAYCMNELK